MGNLLNTAPTKKGVKWNLKLEQSNQKPQWHDICRPKKKKSFETVEETKMKKELELNNHLPNAEYCAATDLWSTLNLIHLMQSLSVFGVSQVLN